MPATPSFGQGTPVTSRALNTAFANLQAQISGAAAAGTLTGTTLAANVVNSSLTSVGTLVSGSIPATLLTGTVASARISGSYTGITGLGTLGSLNVSGVASFSSEILATTSLPAGRGVGIRADPTNAQSILQFTNNAVSAQWSSIVATNNLLNVTTPLTVTGTITATSNIGWSASNYLIPNSGAAQYGSVRVYGDPAGTGWQGYSIAGNAVFMSNGTYFGLYDDTNNKWGILSTRLGTTQLYHNGTSRLGTQADGVNVTSPAPTISIGGWSSGSAYSAIEASGYGYLLLGQAADVNTYLRSNSQVRIGTPSNNTLIVDGTNITITGSMALSSSTNAYVSYTNAADTGLPWSQGPTFQGQTGWAFYSAQVGGYRMGFRGSSTGTQRYFWCADQSLFGNTPNDGQKNDTVNIVGGSAWFSSMPAGSGSTVVNAFGFLRYVTSRRELKDNIVTVDLADGLDRILALRPVEFTMKPEYLADANEYTPFDVKRGFIAQETAEVDHKYGQWGWVDENQMMATESAINGELPLEDATPIYWNHDAVIADLVASIQNISARLQQLETL